MPLKIITAVLFLLIMGLLFTQRFSLPKELSVRITAGAGEDAGYGFGEKLRRGSLIETQNGFLKITIEEKLHDVDQAQTNIWLSKNTTIELECLYQNELVIRLIKGRILTQTQAETPLVIKTNHTKQFLYKGTASFVNYDFLETIHVIPLKDSSVQTKIPETNESFTESVPYSIHETIPVSHKFLEINLLAGDSANFYQWTNTLHFLDMSPTIFYN
ncbi:MAG: hypothetical protein UT30_C0002G0027 [Candidatus Uhrbacteria bacterium GW2011_GWF2_39_13]|uniref:FecR protein domain-containing protein n=1 Tax=Candidatus Uhrbacteria bacterium GW2011_GWF2_39_13 TaxID=1618995 RepID=A0A0G0Q3A7_9BACT|nr:MAG: hypothetical protein UT30_C0002G0027 [Candidatus Uhrbacteria bacterium GW2011_GWF2_39_13]HAU66115.1 hypothetical protein [Candidatus Uhrbacteria bacterium]